MPHPTTDPAALATVLRQHAAAIAAVAADLARYVADDDDSIDMLAGKTRRLADDLVYEACCLHHDACVTNPAADTQAVALLRLASRLLADRTAGGVIYAVLWDVVRTTEGSEAADAEEAAWRAHLAGARAALAATAHARVDVTL